MSILNTSPGHKCVCGGYTCFDYHGEKGNHRYCPDCPRNYILDSDTDRVISVSGAPRRKARKLVKK